MTTFREQIQQDVAAIFADVGPGIENWTWSPVSGIEKSVRAHVVYGSEFASIDPGQADLATVRIQAADIDADGPQPHDKLYDERGVEWTVIAQPGPTLGAAQWKMTCAKGQRVQP